MMLGVLLICLGIAAIKWRQTLSDVMNTMRLWPISPERIRPQTVVFLAIGIIIVGLAMAFGL